jgi:hypothetical protein
MSNTVVWIDGEKVVRPTTPEDFPPAPTQAELDAAQLAADTRDLSPSEFEWLLALTGLEDIWTGLEQNFKPSDRAQYAFLRGTRKKTIFNLDTTLTLVAQFRPSAAAINPSVHLSDVAIKAAWELAINSGV